MTWRLCAARAAACVVGEYRGGANYVLGMFLGAVTRTSIIKHKQGVVPRADPGIAQHQRRRAKQSRPGVIIEIG